MPPRHTERHDAVNTGLVHNGGDIILFANYYHYYYFLPIAAVWRIQ